MGSRKPLSRFVVEIDGGLKRLFSVRQVKQGALILTTHGGSKEVVDGRLKNVLTAKHSIHPSGKSETGANMIHRTSTYDDGTTLEHYLLTHAARDGCFQPIYSRSVLDPRLSRNLDPHPKDKIINLGGYNPEITSMHYTIWLSSAKAADDFPLHPAYSTAVCSYDRFSLNLVWGFTPTPSRPRGVMVHFMSTSEERITDKERRLGYTAGITPGALPEETAACAIYELNHVISYEFRHPLANPMAAQPRNKILTPPVFFPAPPED